MKILQIAPLNMSLPCKGYGGTQRVVYWLSKGLSKLGHDVTIAGPEGTKSDFCDVITNGINSETHENYHNYLGWLSYVSRHFDFVHSHVQRKKFRQYFQGNSSVPYLCSVHGGFGEEVFEDIPQCFPSSSCKEHYKMTESNQFVCPHPIDLDEFTYSLQKESYALFVGNIEWREKRLDIAKQIADRCGITLYAMGPGQQWVSGVNYLGSLYGPEKAKWFSKAKLVLHPTELQESFGLVPLEAAVSGTPVIVGDKAGGVTEFIRESKGALGFPCHDLDTMISNALTLTNSQNNLEQVYQRCRDYGERFSCDKIAEKFISIYRRVIDGNLHCGSN